MAAAVAAFVTGTGVFVLFTAVSYRSLDRVLMNPKNVMRLETACAERLQQYITSQNIGLSDIGRLDGWAENETNLLLTIYHDREVVYYNTEVVIGLPRENQNAWAESGEKAGYDLQLRDGTAYMVLSCFADTGYYLLSDLAGMVLAVSAALTILYACIRKKVQYIALLESELQILKGGDLTCPVSVKGNDELSALAEEMDAMRRAILDRKQAEERAVQANRELVTAMSHDLRTPLTSLLGYVEILSLHKCREEEREPYIRTIREKAYQIKQMSDKLFEYFLVFQREKEDYRLQEVHGVEFLGQVVEESLFDMEHEGFQIERSSDEIHCTLMIDVEAVRRVFGNLFSNLLKYADRTRPVQVGYEQRDGKLRIRFSNQTAYGAKGSESSRIGLRTCETIMKDHGGEFCYEEMDGRFEVTVTFRTSG